MSRLRELNTAKEIIDTLGGTAEVASIYGKTPQMVWAWGDENKIPPKYYTSMKESLDRHGCTAPDRLWGMHEVQKSA